MVAATAELTQSPILVIGGSETSAARLGARARALGVEPVPASDIDEACELLRGAYAHVRAVVLSVDGSLDDPKKDLKRLRDAGRDVTPLLFGRPSGEADRKILRVAGFRLALWEPYDDGTLRFQINRAITADRNVHNRRSPRVPTYLLARIVSSGRTKDAIVYSLSPGGAFLETPRASMEGAVLEIELRLPIGTMRAQARVIFANVPGNLQRANLPLGMGVTWEGLSRDQQHALESFISERLEQLAV